MPKPRDLHNATDCEFDFLDDGNAAVLTLRTSDREDHSFLLSRELVARLSVEIAHKLSVAPPPTGGR